MIKTSLKQLGALSIFNFVFFLGLLFFFTNIYRQPSKIAPPVKKIQPTSEVVQSSSSSTSSFASSSSVRNLFNEISSHNTRQDCWLVINGHIYDITAYFGAHPGGDARMLVYCGKDATSAYQTKDGRGQDHSASAYTLLQQFLIQ